MREFNDSREGSNFCHRIIYVEPLLARDPLSRSTVYIGIEHQIEDKYSSIQLNAKDAAELGRYLIQLAEGENAE